jgi:hypothetical protein
MKRLIEDVEGAGLESLMGRVVTLFCANYHYTGKLVGVNDKFVLLKDPSIVYETGDFADPEWKDAQRLPHDEWYVQTQAIESFGEMK